MRVRLVRAEFEVFPFSGDVRVRALDDGFDLVVEIVEEALLTFLVEVGLTVVEVLVVGAP